MKLESKYFDMIRIRPARSDGGPAVDEGVPGCQWKGCHGPAVHRAPKGRGSEGEFFAFCSAHVRQYNATYNYFDGMSDAQVAEFQKDSLTGHRPTWKVGANAWAHGTHQGTSGPEIRRFAEQRQAKNRAFQSWREKQSQEATERPGRGLKPLERKAMAALGLGERSGKDEIKARFKELVKRHHPDSNGGDRGSEEKLREIIQAYNYLKQAGLV